MPGVDAADRALRRLELEPPSRAGRGPGEERRQLGADRDRAGARASAAVRRGEGLVQVQVHDVEAHVAGAHDPRIAFRLAPS